MDALALRRENKLYPQTLQSSIVDAALELVEPLDTGPAGLAVAGGWAAIEALLSAPGESRSNAAGRLATIVVLSYPRAELTTLSYRIKGKPLVAMLDTLTKNRERAERPNRKFRIITIGRGHNGNSGLYNLSFT